MSLSYEVLSHINQVKLFTWLDYIQYKDVDMVREALLKDNMEQWIQFLNSSEAKDSLIKYPPTPQFCSLFGSERTVSSTQNGGVYAKMYYPFEALIYRQAIEMIRSSNDSLDLFVANQLFKHVGVKRDPYLFEALILTLKEALDTDRIEFGTFSLAYSVQSPIGVQSPEVLKLMTGQVQGNQSSLKEGEFGFSYNTSDLYVSYLLHSLVDDSLVTPKKLDKIMSDVSKGLIQVASDAADKSEEQKWSVYFRPDSQLITNFGFAFDETHIKGPYRKTVSDFDKSLKIANINAVLDTLKDNWGVTIPEAAVSRINAISEAIGSSLSDTLILKQFDVEEGLKAKDVIDELLDALFVNDESLRRIKDSELKLKSVEPLLPPTFASDLSSALFERIQIFSDAASNELEKKVLSAIAENKHTLKYNDVHCIKIRAGANNEMHFGFDKLVPLVKAMARTGWFKAGMKEEGDANFLTYLIHGMRQAVEADQEKAHSIVKETQEMFLKEKEVDPVIMSVRPVLRQLQYNIHLHQGFLRNILSMFETRQAVTQMKLAQYSEHLGNHPYFEVQDILSGLHDVNKSINHVLKMFQDLEYSEADTLNYEDSVVEIVTSTITRGYVSNHNSPVNTQTFRDEDWINEVDGNSGIYSNLCNLSVVAEKLLNGDTEISRFLNEQHLKKQTKIAPNKKGKSKSSEFDEDSFGLDQVL